MHNTDFSARDPLPGVAELFSQRWSPRAFAIKPVPNEILAQILDAARWSPSCFNEQPWRFITCTTDSHQQFVDLLAEGNQSWARQAPVLGFILAERQFMHNGKENAHAQFDAGAAWMAMTLQARLLDLYTHGMAGIDYDGVYRAFNIDRDKTAVICGFALGYRGDAPGLPASLQQKEKPSPRKSLTEIWQPVSGN